MAERKNPELDAKHQAILRKMMQLPENKQCADCKGPSPRWASTNLGIFVCIACSGIHRKLGTHISQVRSITLDTWTPAQVAHFQKFGNARAAQYFEACLPPDFRRPASGDSMQMERFIRDKYEKKCFITVENGGLGGNTSAAGLRGGSGNHLNGGASRSSVSGTQGAYAPGRYDDGSIGRAAALPLSYGDTFRAGRPTAGGTRRSPAAGSGTFNSNRGMRSGAPRGNAIQRAHTLKEIMNMGFPAQLAARAVEASAGDLQKAVDWVLENSETSNGAAPQHEKPRQAAMERDLLDFGDSDPVTKPVAASAPKSVSTESLVGSAVAPPAPPKPQQDFADFADFGAFESALPATSNSTSTAGSHSGKGSLSTSIASLYAQGPSKLSTQLSPKLMARVSAGLPQLAKIGNATNQENVKTSHNSATLTLAAVPGSVQERSRRTMAPDAIPSFKWPTATKPTPRLAPKSQQATPIETSKPAHGDAVRNEIAAVNADTGTPPPPPIEDMVVSNTNIPPPPSVPPPSAEHASEPEAATADIDSQKSATNSAKAPDVPVQENANNKQDKNEIEEDEEDPFAALSMFALNSATSGKKQGEKKCGHSNPTVQDKLVLSESPATVNECSANMNLDDLLG